MKLNKLDNRLQAAASLVRQGAVVADIGSDHAYLPIYLCLSGIISSAVASDINEGPVINARENVAENHLCDKIQVKRADGLKGLEDYTFDTVCVCGMGGELIFDIINCETVKKRKPELILQPMSSIHDLSYLLAKTGFVTVDDVLVNEGSKIYRVMKVLYTGIPYSVSPIEAYIGSINLRRADSVTLEYVKRVRQTNKKIIASKQSAGSDVSCEQLLEDEIENYLNNITDIP